MPFYTARHKKTKKEKKLFLEISEVDEWEKTNPNWEIAVGAPLIHSGTGLGLKTSKADEGFKDRLREIDKKLPGSTIKNYVDM